MADNTEAVIISAVRTATGKFMGSLKGFKATELGAMVVREAINRAGLQPDQIEEVIMGNVVQAGLGQTNRDNRFRGVERQRAQARSLAAR